MKKMLRTQMVLAVAVTLAGSMCFAEDGAAIFKAKCAVCHGAAGTPSAAMIQAMGMKPVSDPSMQALGVARIETQVKNGGIKMKPIAGLSDTQVKAVAEYFKTLK